MSLSIFADALPYSEMAEKYENWFDNMQSSLHWQLYCNKYPDERGAMVDWVKEPEKRKSVRFWATVLSPLDHIGNLGVLAKKFLDRKVYRKNTFANIPFKFRKEFTEKGKYLFWAKETYSQEPIFDGYKVVSQDEGHLSFETAIEKLRCAIENGEKNIFFETGFPDAIGHLSRRGEIYSSRLGESMKLFKEAIQLYIDKNPDEEVLIVSDHGMSTVEKKVDAGLEKKFGKASKKNYIAFSDSCIMCVWAYKEGLTEQIKEHLSTLEYGHVLTDEEREKYGVANKLFGEIIFILKEGNVFKDNWFGKSLKKPSPHGAGMHGFWSEWEAKDQIASVVLINGKRTLEEKYDYPKAYALIKEIMQGDKQ